MPRYQTIELKDYFKSVTPKELVNTEINQYIRSVIVSSWSQNSDVNIDSHILFIRHYLFLKQKLLHKDS